MQSLAKSFSVTKEGFIISDEHPNLILSQLEGGILLIKLPKPKTSESFLILSSCLALSQCLINQSINQSSGIDWSIDLINISWAGTFLSTLTIIHIAVLTQPLFCISLILSTPNKSFIQCPTNSSKMQTRCLVVKHCCSFMVLE